MMCYALPGPRCSRNGLFRVEQAQKRIERFEARQAMLRAKAKSKDKEEARVARKELNSTRFLNKKTNARLRKAYAEKVYRETVGGAAALREAAAEAEAAGLDSKARKLNKQAQKGEEGHERAKKDLKLVQGHLRSQESERSAVRTTQALSDSGETRYNFRGVPAGKGAYTYPHPSSVLEAVRALSREERQEYIDSVLTNWTDEDYDRASEWVEGGHTSRWIDNPNARPKRTAGRRLSTESKIQRLNMPDGEIVESRSDVHICKRDDGTYVVATRLTVASSWEDASPIHETQAELGSYLARDRGVSSNTQYQEVEYKTLEAAQRGARTAKRNATGRVQAASAARVAREGHIERVHREAGTVSDQSRLSRFDTRVWPRYKLEPKVKGRQADRKVAEARDRAANRA